MQKQGLLLPTSEWSEVPDALSLGLIKLTRKWGCLPCFLLPSPFPLPTLNSGSLNSCYSCKSSGKLEKSARFEYSGMESSLKIPWVDSNVQPGLTIDQLPIFNYQVLNILNDISLFCSSDSNHLWSGLMVFLPESCVPPIHFHNQSHFKMHCDPPPPLKTLLLISPLFFGFFTQPFAVCPLYSSPPPLNSLQNPHMLSHLLAFAYAVFPVPHNFLLLYLFTWPTPIMLRSLVSTLLYFFFFLK